MKKALILLIAIFLTGCYTVLKVPMQERASEASVGASTNHGDYCYTQKYYETVYIREKSSSTRVVRVPRYRVNCINGSYSRYHSSRWSYYGGYYHHSDSYEDDQKKREKDYRPRGRSVGRSSSKKDDRNSQRSRDRSRKDDQDSDRDRSRSGNRSRSGSGDSGN